jgi:hypothetical protein
MLIKVYEDGIGNLLGLLHVNLSHVTTAYKIRKNVNSEYTYHVRLDDGRNYATHESCYDRITQWMADQEDARDLMRAVAEDDGERVSTGEVMDQVRNDDAVEQLVYALDECGRYACLCEYCPHRNVDFDTDPHDIPCCYDFDQLYKAAGMERPK